MMMLCIPSQACDGGGVLGGDVGAGDGRAVEELGRHVAGRARLPVDRAHEGAILELGDSKVAHLAPALAVQQHCAQREEAGGEHGRGALLGRVCALSWQGTRRSGP